MGRRVSSTGKGWGEPESLPAGQAPPGPHPGPGLTMVSRLLAAVPVHRPMILSMHFLWMAALHS